MVGVLQNVSFGNTLTTYFNQTVSGNNPVTLTNYQTNGSSLQYASYDSALGLAKLANSGYLQNGWLLNEFNIVAGIRATFFDLNQELNISPRIFDC